MDWLGSREETGGSEGHKGKHGREWWDPTLAGIGKMEGGRVRPLVDSY